MNFFKFLTLNLTDLLFVGIAIFLFILFIADFKLTNKRSWLILLSVTALGGLTFWQIWRRKRLLKELEAREAQLDELKNKLDELKKEHKMSREAYQKALQDLEAARVEAGLAVMAADAELQEEMKKIELEYQNMTVEESLQRIKKALQKPQ